MQEILFRGISRDTQTFVFGDLLQWKDGDCDICVNDLDTNEKTKFPVYSKTVGQFTGLTDINGKKVFEGDIIKKYFESMGTQYAKIGWSKEYTCFKICPLNDWRYAEIKDCEVIGNIHENPELLKAGAQE